MQWAKWSAARVTKFSPPPPLGRQYHMLKLSKPISEHLRNIFVNVLVDGMFPVITLGVTRIQVAR
jgi:hypothetical protein